MKKQIKKKVKIAKPVKKVKDINSLMKDKQLLKKADEITLMVKDVDLKMGDFEKMLKDKGLVAPVTEKEMIKEFLWEQFKDLMNYLKSTREKKQRFYRAVKEGNL